MQKSIIAMAVVGLMSGAAFADTSVTIGGKYDAGYQFKRTANKDAANGTSTGGSTTETLGDGAASTSRITVQAKEDLMPGWNAMVDLDLRFGTVEEGKSISVDSTGKVTNQGGITTNDKKALYLNSPYGSVRWGVMNLVSQQYWDYEEKPYMVNVKDLEIVKYGVSEKRHTSLTQRATEYDTPVFSVGPVQFRFKGNMAFGDNQKSGANNTDTPAQTGNGNVYAFATTGAVGKLVNWTLSAHHRNTTSFAAGTRNDMAWQEHSVSIHPIDGLKIGMNFNVYKGYDGKGTYFAEKNTNFVVAYNFGDRFQVGIERSHLNDVASSRNSGKGWMIGGSYFLSKSAYFYLARAKEDFARNEGTVSGGYDGTKDGFIGSFSKVDNTYTRVGFVKEF